MMYQKSSVPVLCKKDMSRFQIIIRLLRMAKPLFVPMTIATIFGILNNLSNIALIGWGAWLISKIFVLNTSPAVWEIVLLFIFALIKSFSSYLEQAENHNVAFRLLANLRTKFYKKLEPLAPAKLINKRSGDIISTISGDIELIEVFFAHTISPVVIAAIVSLTVTIFLSSWWGIIALVILPFQFVLGMVVPLIWERIVRSRGQTIQAILGENNAHLTDSLQGLKTVLLFNYGKKRKEEIANKGLVLNKAKGKYSTAEGFLKGIINAIVLTADIVIVVVSVIGFQAGILSIQGLIIVVAIAISSFGPLLSVSSVSHYLTLTFAAAERLFRIIDEEPVVKDIPECSSKIPSDYDIEFNNVCFRYSPNESNVLDGFSMSVQQGTTIALVGESGCGKSTSLRLLLRFWNLDSGEIIIGKRNINNICQKTLYQMIAVVSYDSFLFNTTIKENIQLGNPSGSMDEIIKYAKMVYIHDFIETLPKRYETQIGEIGDRLSSGEKQRILIARALMKNTPILILDEPVSNLDTLNENAIQKTLNEVCKNKTVILVTHRLSSLAHVDCVYQLRNGKCYRIEEIDTLLQS